MHIAATFLPWVCSSQELSWQATHRPGNPTSSWRIRCVWASKILVCKIFPCPSTFGHNCLSLLCRTQYYDRSRKILGEIRQTLNSDVTAEDRLGDLETFKKDASAYGAVLPPFACEAVIMASRQIGQGIY